MQLQIFTVDAFSESPLGGNPAAIVPLTQDIDDEIMLKIANEMNISETTFIRPLDEEGSPASWTESPKFSLRWFTPACEIPLCGHATLATAHAIFECLGSKRDEIIFDTLSGPLKVKRDGKLFVMDFPSNPPLPLESNQDILSRIAEACTSQLKNRIREVRYCPIVKYLLVRLEDSVTVDEFKAMSPNFSEMASMHDGSLVKAMGVTMIGDTARTDVPFRYHAYSRFFGTWLGVNEDPVCGSWHTVMGPYWKEQLGTEELLFRQCSKRGGDVKVSVPVGDRVFIAGPASTVIKGYINI